MGIIGNICCSDKAIDTIGSDQELARQILSRLVSDDSLILVQLIRILQLLAWKIRQNPQSDWVTHFIECQFFGDSITFMLKSSTNGTLMYCNASQERSSCIISVILKSLSQMTY